METLYGHEFRDLFTSLCERAKNNAPIDPQEFKKYEVKRGLRNADGSGVMAGLTRVCKRVRWGDKYRKPSLQEYADRKRK